MLAIAVFVGGYVLGAATIFAVVVQRPNMAGWLMLVALRRLFQRW